jgi:vanillate/4-hydroxybenzoate decarboxylase subunit C
VAYDDLRSFLDELDRNRQLLRVTEEVTPEPDLAAAANAACRIGPNAPALYFDNVTGFTRARIAMNVHGSWANHAIALAWRASSRGARGSSRGRSASSPATTRAAAGCR